MSRFQSSVKATLASISPKWTSSEQRIPMRRLSGCFSSAKKSDREAFDLVADALHAGGVGGLSNAEFDP